MGVTQVIKIINVEDAPDLELMSYFLGTQEISEGVTKDYKFSKEQILTYVGLNLIKKIEITGATTGIITSELFLNKKVIALFGDATYVRDSSFTQSNIDEVNEDGLGNQIILTYDKVNAGQIFWFLAI